MMGMGGPGMMLQGQTSKPVAVSATLKRFWRYFAAYKLILLIVAVLVVVSTYIQVLTPDLLGQAVDCYIIPATQSAVGGAGQAAAAGVNCWYGPLPAGATSNDYI